MPVRGTVIYYYIEINPKKFFGSPAEFGVHCQERTKCATYQMQSLYIERLFLCILKKKFLSSSQHNLVNHLLGICLKMNVFINSIQQFTSTIKIENKTENKIGTC